MSNGEVIRNESLLERLFKNINYSNILTKINFLSIYIQIAFAVSLSIIAAHTAISLANEYYHFAPFYYDSADYLMTAFKFHELIASSGRLQAILQAIQSKDGFDLLVRILFKPKLLTKTYGHMVVVLPFLSLFFFLAIHYVLKNTKSWVSALVPVCIVFTFPLIFETYMGIADYWKESIAVWILGSAIFSWLLSDGMKKLPWTFLCSLLLSVLVMERSALAVYTAFIFFPLFILSTYESIKSFSFRKALTNIGVFVIPLVLFGGIIILAQWKLLYSYYFVSGYAYASPSQVANILYEGVLSKLNFPFLLLSIIFCCCLGLITNWKQRRRDILISLWIVVGFPLIVIATHSLYAGFYTVWPVLLVTLLATVLPSTSHQVISFRIMIVFLGVIITCSILKYYFSEIKTQAMAKSQAHWVPLFDEITNIAMVQPKPCYVSLLFDTSTAPFIDHVNIRRRILHGQIKLEDFPFTDNTYFTLTPKQRIALLHQIAKEHIDKLEKHHSIVVTYCDPEKALNTTAFPLGPFQNLPTIVAEETNYLLHSPHWQAISKLESMYGNLYVYKYSSKPLTDKEKWQSLFFKKELSDDIPINLAVAPGIKLYNFESIYKPKLAHGITSISLSSGKSALTLMLFSDKKQDVKFHAHVKPGPSKKNTPRTLVMTSDLKKPFISTVPISQEQDISIKFPLQSGLNIVKLAVKDLPDNTLTPSVTRDLMVLIESPWLQASI